MKTRKTRNERVAEVIRRHCAAMADAYPEDAEEYGELHGGDVEAENEASERRLAKFRQELKEAMADPSD